MLKFCVRNSTADSKKSKTKRKYYVIHSPAGAVTSRLHEAQRFYISSRIAH